MKPILPGGMHIRAVLMACCVCAGFSRAQAQTPGPEQGFPADLVPTSPTETPPPNLGALYMMSAWPTLPPMPAPLAFGPREGGAAGLRPLVWSGVPTNAAVYYSASWGAVLIDDRAEVAQRMLAQAASDLPPIPGDGDPLGGTSGGGASSAPWPYGTNQFWIEPLCVATNLFYATLHGTTNGSTYLIASTDEFSPLGNSTWSAEGTVLGGLGDATAFAVGIGSRTNKLCIRATPCDECAGTALPLWWQLEYFGVTGVPADGDYDGDGVSNLAEYLQGRDPNKIAFYAGFTNFCVNSTTAHGTFEVCRGVPWSMAIMINSKDFAAAQWQPYTPQFDVSLGPTDGVYNVWIGLRGPSADSRATWNWSGLTRDLEPPAITITSVSPGLVTWPLIDLRGFSPEPLRSLYYDLANDAGGVTNVQGSVTGQYWDSVTREFTTNWFLCWDLQLTNGPNTVTLRATDTAGNTSTNVFIYNLDLTAGTNPPVLSLYWPQDGDKVCGSRFTLRGRLDDPTAKVTALITDAATNLNGGKCLVEPNGLLWVENLPLAPGTNFLTLYMTNASGYGSLTNLAVVHSDDLNLTMDPVPQEALTNWMLTVTGTIDSADFTVWVNGLMATNLADNGDGTWSWEVDGVTLNSGGTAILQAVAIPSSVNGGQGDRMETWIDNAVPGNPTAPGRRALEAGADQPWQAYTRSYHYDYNDSWAYTNFWTGEWEHYRHWMIQDWTDARALPGDPRDQKRVGACVWGRAAEGVDDAGVHYAWSDRGAEQDYAYVAQPRNVRAFITYSNWPGLTYTQGWTGLILPEPNEKWEEHTAYAEDAGWDLTVGQLDVHERQEVTLRTGGKRHPKWDNFFEVWGSAAKFVNQDTNGNWVAQTVPPGEIQMLGKPLLTNGIGYPKGMNFKALADNEEHGLTPVVTCPCYRFTWGVQKHTLNLGHHCPIYGDTTRTDLGVGEEVRLSFSSPITNVFWLPHWSTTAGSVSPTNGTWTGFTAPSNAIPATVTATVRDERVNVGFGVVGPSGSAYAQVEGTDCWNGTLPAAMAGMYLRVVMAPTNVSLYRVQIIEVPSGPTDVQGYFSIYGAPDHDANHRAGQWYDLGCDNAWLPGNDHASSDVYAQPWSGPGWSGGSFTWRIPVRWKIGNGEEHSLDPWDQKFYLLGDGTVRITKFGRSVTRHANERCGTAH
jgi:hypothetical protein